MKQVLLKQGQAVLDDVPAPQLQTGFVLIQVAYSCISAGTEMSGLALTGMPLWRLALKKPQQVKKALQFAANHGIKKTRQFIQGQLHAGRPTGYSAAGRVVAVGDGVTDFKIGDLVACAGAQYAHHAEWVAVPNNLVVKVPDNVDLSDASVVTLGAIALQGIRRLNPTLGETIVVIGLGILGQLTVQMLKANGVRVIGLDINDTRVAQAKAHGLDVGVPFGEDQRASVERLTDGVGADGVIITASSPANDIVASAFGFCRRKGRVVLVGDVGLNINRADIYEKELDFFISTSYGPGRYDNNYEEKGLDYPLAYVRWTENRNMAEFLRMLAEGKVILSNLVSAIYPISHASKAYSALKSAEKPLIVLLEYPQEAAVAATKITVNKSAVTTQKVNLGVIGLGNFAKAIHMPNIQKLSKLYQLVGVTGRKGHNAKAVAKQFHAEYATTDIDELLNDDRINAVLIATRHDQHADLTLAALERHKHVFVEKPTALTPSQLQRITDFYQQRSAAGEGSPMLMTGYNRRFSPYAQKIAKKLADRHEPMIINYRMNAGFLPKDHWVHGQEGGGRNIGEACHIYDLFTFLTNAEVESVTAKAIQPQSNCYLTTDNFVTVITFKDGSVATLTYTALGSATFPKEQMEVFCEGKVFKLDDYKSLTGFGTAMRPVKTKLANKGHVAELQAFANALLGEQNWPIPLWQQIQVQKIAFAVEQQITDAVFSGEPCVA